MGTNPAEQPGSNTRRGGDRLLHVGADAAAQFAQALLQIARVPSQGAAQGWQKFLDRRVRIHLRIRKLMIDHFKQMVLRRDHVPQIGRQNIGRCSHILSSECV